MRVLILAPFAPSLRAHHGGGRAIAELVVALASAHDVGVLYLQAADKPTIDPELEQRCAFTQAVQYDPDRSGLAKLRFRVQLWLGFVRGQPLRVMEHRVPEFARQLTTIVDRWKPDLIQVEYDIMAQYMIDRSGTPWSITIHEPGRSTARERPRSRDHIGRLRQRLDSISWARFERRLAQRAPAIVVFSEQDRAHFTARYPTAKVNIIPLATSLPSQPCAESQVDPKNIVFVGNFEHPPNIDAALHLIDDIMPRVWERRPDAIATIVGYRPPLEISDRQSDRVIVTGEVPTTEPYLCSAAVVVAPIRLGGGTRVKVLEALGYGKAVVATPLAAAGLDVTSGDHLLIAESDVDFAASIVDLLDDAPLRHRLGSAARTWTTQHRDPTATAASYARIYRTLTQRPTSLTARQARELGRSNAVRFVDQPALLTESPVGTFHGLGARARLARDLLLTLGRFAPADWLITSISARRWAPDALRSLIVGYSYWQGLRQASSSETWLSLTHPPVILMYHSVSARRPAGTYTIRTPRFEQQIRWLSRRGYRSLSPESLATARAKDQLPPGKSVVITFDDGYRDNLEQALPILQRYRFTATLFVVTGYVGQTNRWDRGTELAGEPLLTWDQLRQWLAAGMAIGAHTRTHPRLTELDADGLAAEIGGSRSDIQGELGIACETFAFPFGLYSDATVDAVAAAGFSAACVSDSGVITTETSLHRMRRIEIRGTDSLTQFVLSLWSYHRMPVRRFLSRFIRGK